jgi:hypothetical protein
MSKANIKPPVNNSLNENKINNSKANVSQNPELLIAGHICFSWTITVMQSISYSYAMKTFLLPETDLAHVSN